MAGWSTRPACCRTRRRGAADARLAIRVLGRPATARRQPLPRPDAVGGRDHELFDHDHRRDRPCASRDCRLAQPAIETRYALEVPGGEIDLEALTATLKSAPGVTSVEPVPEAKCAARFGNGSARARQRGFPVPRW